MDGFNMDFRPESYWPDGDETAGVISGVMGQMRRQMIRDLLASGVAIEDALLGEQLSERTSGLLESIDPRWMGGEYLPPLRAGEVEIARIVLNSTTWDVYSVRARRRAKRIAYRIVDEYAGVWHLKRQTSSRPLSMREIVHLIDTATVDGSDSQDLTDWLREGCGDPEDAVGFVTVESEIYPELEAYYAAKAEAWLERVRGA